MTNPFESPDEEHYAIVQHLVDGFYAQFRHLVEQRRPSAAASSDFAMMTDGRVFTGVEAARLGLVDQAGTLRDAFGVAKSLAGIEDARLVKYHAGGVEPRSPYNTSTPIAPRLTGDTTVNVLSMEVSPGALSPGFYYVWWPPAP
jgi:ClpP class serine protease